MKLIMTVTVTYDAPDDEKTRLERYGTIVPEEMAAVDQEQLTENPELIPEMLELHHETATISVRVG